MVRIFHSNVSKCSDWACDLSNSRSQGHSLDGRSLFYDFLCDSISEGSSKLYCDGAFLAGPSLHGWRCSFGKTKVGVIMACGVDSAQEEKRWLLKAVGLVTCGWPHEAGGKVAKLQN